MLKPDTLDLVRRPEAFVQLGAVAQVAHFDLCKSTAFSGLYMVDLHSRPQAAVMFKHVSGADFVSVNFRHEGKPRQKVDEEVKHPIY